MFFQLLCSTILHHGKSSCFGLPAAPVRTAQTTTSWITWILKKKFECDDYEPRSEVIRSAFLSASVCMISVCELWLWGEVVWRLWHVMWHVSGGKKTNLTAKHSAACLWYLFRAQYLFIYKKCIHICLHLLYLVSQKDWTASRDTVNNL